MDRHHENFVHDLREHQDAAGGPVTLTQFLRLARPAISVLRDNKVAWEWIAARILAVHQTEAGEHIPQGIPAARRRSARLISSLWARVTVVPDKEHNAANTDDVQTTEQATQDRPETAHSAHVSKIDVAVIAAEPVTPKRCPPISVPFAGIKPEPQATDPPDQSPAGPTDHSRSGINVLITGGHMIDQMSKLKELSRS